MRIESFLAEKKFEEWKRNYPGQFREDLSSYIVLDEETGEPACTVTDNGVIVGIESNGRTINLPGSSYDVSHFTYVVLCPTCLALGENGMIVTQDIGVGIVKNESEKSVNAFVQSETMRNGVLRRVSEKCSRRKEKL